MKAAMLNRQEIACILLKNGADTSPVDNKGKTALDWADEMDSMEVAEIIENNFTDYKKFNRSNLLNSMYED